MRRILRFIVRATVAVVLVVLFATIAGVALLESSWGKDQLRALIVRQANRFLTAELSIGKLSGSLARDLELDDVVLSFEGRPIVRIDAVHVAYSPIALWRGGTTVESIRVVHPQVVASRRADGRWELASLTLPRNRPPDNGPPRRIELQAIEVSDGTVQLTEPWTLGPVHVPADIRSLQAALAFERKADGWALRFDRMSWVGQAPELTVNSLTGTLGHDATGWSLDRLTTETPRSNIAVNGAIRDGRPSVLDMQVHAARFAFQEWAPILPAIARISVDSRFDAALNGPLDRLHTVVDLSGNGGDTKADLVLDTTVPGWHGAGNADLTRLNLARWLTRPEQVSDITGHVTFTLDFGFGRSLPSGPFTFAGARAMFRNYAADHVQLRGRMTPKEAVIEQADAMSYGAPVQIAAGTIGLAEPWPFRFEGRVTGIDLVNLPTPIPVPHVDSRLTFDYNVSGQFSSAFVVGRASFSDSEFIGAHIGRGTSGSIRTDTMPIQFDGEGDIENADLHRFGDTLDVAWLREPRYEGTVSGHFRVDGAAGHGEQLRLSASGRVSHGELFEGVISDSDVSLDISGGSIAAGLNGHIEKVNPAVLMGDARASASLTGQADLRATVHDAMIRTTSIEDWDATGRLQLSSSVVRDFTVDALLLDGAVKDGMLTVASADVTAPAVTGTATGKIPLTSKTAFDLAYDVSHADLSALEPLTHVAATGEVATRGRLTGGFDSLHAAGDATVLNLDASGVRAATMTGAYDFTDAPGRPPTVTVTGQASTIDALGQALESAAGRVGLENNEARFDLTLTQTSNRMGRIGGVADLHLDASAVDVRELTIALGQGAWRLEPRTPATRVSWDADGVAVSDAAFVSDADARARVGVSGTWRQDGGGALHVTMADTQIETLVPSSASSPARYAGTLDADAIVRGTLSAPLVSGTMTIKNGRVDRLPFELLTGRIGSKGDALDVDFRLDQAAGVWFTAAGTVPLSFIDPARPDGPLDVSVVSSSIGLGLFGGLTDVIRNAGGQLQMNLRATGTGRDPHLGGSVDINDAEFIVASTGVRYRKGHAALRLSEDRLTVAMMHIEDTDGHALDVQGSLGTRQFKASDLAIDATARRLDVLNNDFGKVDVNATLRLRGDVESPRIAGTIEIDSGNVKVDRVLERALFQPYATTATTPQLDAVAVLNPWSRLGLDVFLRVRETLRLTGTNVQVASGAPLGLGDINIRPIGDLYLYKDPQQPMQITGSLDSLSGTYAFQGRRFTIDESRSSVNFVGDLDPNLFVSVTRVIDAVETRVTITGSLRQPELQLSSTPPLDQSDVLSLIVFGTAPGALSSVQQQELAVRAGAIAAGFLATPLLSAVENDLGLEAFQLEPSGDFGGGPKVTIGQELAPGLIARFSRQFGQEQFNEVTIEYYLSRLLQLRATFSDAQATAAQTGFRRVERAGIDLLFFLSF